MPLFPLFADLRGREVLVVGGGEVALRKVEALLNAGARGCMRWRCSRRWRNDVAKGGSSASKAIWLDAAWLVVVATDDRFRTQPDDRLRTRFDEIGIACEIVAGIAPATN